MCFSIYKSKYFIFPRAKKKKLENEIIFGGFVNDKRNTVKIFEGFSKSKDYLYALDWICGGIFHNKTML